MCSLERAARDVVLDAALVRAALDLEVAVVAPLVVPRVLDPPVRRAVLDAPPDHLYGVACQKSLPSTERQ